MKFLDFQWYWTLTSSSNWIFNTCKLLNFRLEYFLIQTLSSNLSETVKICQFVNNIKWIQLKRVELTFLSHILKLSSYFFHEKKTCENGLHKINWTIFRDSLQSRRKRLMNWSEHLEKNVKLALTNLFPSCNAAFSRLSFCPLLICLFILMLQYNCPTWRQV